MGFGDKHLLSLSCAPASTYLALDTGQGTCPACSSASKDCALSNMENWMVHPLWQEWNMLYSSESDPSHARDSSRSGLKLVQIYRWIQLPIRVAVVGLPSVLLMLIKFSNAVNPMIAKLKFDEMWAANDVSPNVIYYIHEMEHIFYIFSDYTLPGLQFWCIFGSVLASHKAACLHLIFLIKLAMLIPNIFLI